jgi:hypothetical protein
MRTNDEINGHRNALMGLLLKTEAHLQMGKYTAKQRQEGEALICQFEGEIELCSWMLGEVPYTWLDMPDEE